VRHHPEGGDLPQDQGEHRRGETEEHTGRDLELAGAGGPRYEELVACGAPEREGPGPLRQEGYDGGAFDPHPQAYDAEEIPEDVDEGGGGYGYEGCDGVLGSEERGLEHPREETGGHGQRPYPHVFARRVEDVGRGAAYVDGEQFPVGEEEKYEESCSAVEGVLDRRAGYGVACFLSGHLVVGVGRHGAGVEVGSGYVEEGEDVGCPVDEGGGRSKGAELYSPHAGFGGEADGGGVDKGEEWSGYPETETGKCEGDYLAEGWRGGGG